ncbi:MAG: YdbC family protein [Bacillota bacterium]
MPEVKFEIKESLGIISESAKGWSKELNLVSWNDRNPKYDIREWSPDHRRMGKGITMSKEELKVLKELIEKAGIE